MDPIRNRLDSFENDRFFEFAFSKRETLKTTWQAVEQLTQNQSESSNENRARNNRATVANCRLHQLTRSLALTIVSSGLLNANIDDANVHVEYVEENFSRAFASLEKFAVETESLGWLIYRKLKITQTLKL